MEHRESVHGCHRQPVPRNERWEYSTAVTKTSVASELTQAICVSGLLPDPSSNPARA